MSPDKVKMMDFRSPSADDPEFVMAVEDIEGHVKTVVIPLSFDRLRHLTKRAQECLMRYPVQPRPPSTAA
jgi:hypothetical protein